MILIHAKDERRPDLFEEFPAENYVHHEQQSASGLKGVKDFYAMSLNAFPNLQTIIDDEIAEGDKILIRSTMRATHQGELLGIPATGKQVTLSMVSIFRLANDRIGEAWFFSDNMALMQQLGVVPTPGAA